MINCTQFEVRQAHFDTCPRFEFFDADGCYRSGFKSKPVKASYADLCRVMKDNPHDNKVLGGQCAQQTLQSVVESFRSFNRLLQQYFQGEGSQPRMPNYRKPGGLAPLTFLAQAVQFNLETGECRLPISLENAKAVGEQFGLSELWIPGSSGIRPDQIVEVRILPRNNEFYAEYVYKHGNEGPSCHLGIDPTLADCICCFTAVFWAPGAVVEAVMTGVIEASLCQVQRF